MANHMSPAKVALVTGSSSGIGANIAIDLARAGYRVIVTGRTIDKLTKIVRQCNEAFSLSTQKHLSVINDKDEHDNYNDARQSTCAYFVADLSDFSQLDKLIDFIKINFNRLDVLVNNACWRGKVREILDPQAFDDLAQVMHVNVTVPTYLIHRCLFPLKPNNGMGVVLNISSIAGQVVVPLHLYSISKACLSEVSKQVSVTSETSGVFAVTISPGPVLTLERPHHAAMSGLTLVNRVGTTQEISNLVTHVLENIHLFNGKELTIDGGYTARTLTKRSLKVTQPEPLCPDGVPQP